MKIYTFRLNLLLSKPFSFLLNNPSLLSRSWGKHRKAAFDIGRSDAFQWFSPFSSSSEALSCIQLLLYALNDFERIQYRLCSSQCRPRLLQTKISHHPSDKALVFPLLNTNILRTKQVPKLLLKSLLRTPFHRCFCLKYWWLLIFLASCL